MPAYYIKRSGNVENQKLGETRMVRSNSEPSTLDYVLEQEYTDTLPLIGEPISLFLGDDTELFRGNIDEINWGQIQETNDVLSIPIKCKGLDLRLYRRVTFDRSLTPDQAVQFRSFSGRCSTDGTTVTWADGTEHGDDLEGDRFSKEFLRLDSKITINGVLYTVASVDSPRQLTLTATAGTQTGVTYSYDVYSGQVIKYLIDNCLEDEGFTYDVGGTTIQNGERIGEIIFDPPVAVIDAIQQIVKLNDGYVFRDDLDQLCHFGPWTTVAAPSDFTDDPETYKRNINLHRSRADVRNVEVSQFDIAGASIIEDTFNGDDTVKDWFLSKKILKLIQVTLNEIDITERVREWTGTTDIDADFYFQTRDWKFWQSSLAVTLGPDDVLVVKYYQVGGNLGEVSDFDSIDDRKAIEVTGSGKYEAYIDRTTLKSWVDAATDAENSIARNKDDVTDGTLVTKDLGYDVNQVLTLNITDNKINEQFIIERVEASDSALMGADPDTFGDFYYTLSLSSLSRRITENDVLRGLFDNTGGPPRDIHGGSLGSGDGTASPTGGTGPAERTFLIKDSTTGTDVGDHVTVYGGIIAHPSVVRRVTGVLRKTITSNLTVQFRAKQPDGTTTTIGSFTIPSTQAINTPIEYTSFTNASLLDLSVIIPDITASDGQKDKNGVASFTIEWVSRNMGQPTGGVAYQHEWNPEATYSVNDVVFYNGSAYVSIINDNTNFQPSDTPTAWGPIAAQGGTGNTGSTGAPSPHGFQATFDGGGSALTAGLVAYTTLITGGTLVGWKIVTDTGTATIKVWRKAAGTAKPTSADSLNTSGVSITTGTAVQSTTLTDFSSTTFAANDIIGIELSAVSGGATHINVVFNFGTPSSSSTSPPPVGDDTAMIQLLLDNVADGGTIIIDGMHNISDTLYLNGKTNIAIRAHAVNGGGFVATNTGLMTGPESVLLSIRNCPGFYIKDLEFDCNNKKTGGILYENCSNCKIEGVDIHDIDYDTGGTGPYAGIRSYSCVSEIVVGCTVTNTGGVTGGEGVRGIWLGNGSTGYSNGALIDNCQTSDTGHTGIIIDGTGGTIQNCTVTNSLTQGTGYKLLPRGPIKTTYFLYNTANGTTNAGLMIESNDGNYQVKIHIANNNFTDCGDVATTFGAIYTSGNSTNKNILFSNNTLTNCRSTGALRFALACLFENNTFVSMSGRNKLYLETDDHDITLTSSGTVDTPVGPNTSNIWVDGVQIA